MYLSRATYIGGVRIGLPFAGCFPEHIAVVGSLYDLSTFWTVAYCVVAYAVVYGMVSRALNRHSSGLSETSCRECPFSSVYRLLFGAAVSQILFMSSALPRLWSVTFNALHKE